MRKMIMSVFAAALLFLTGARSYAASEEATDHTDGVKSEISGEVTEIKGDRITIKDKMGKTNTYEFTDSRAQRIKPGDVMTINIRKLGTNFVSMFAGTVTAVKDNTLTIEDKTGGTYSFKITDSKALENIKSGDLVSVKIQKGEEMEKAEGTPGATPTVAPETTPTPVAPKTTPTATPKTTPGVPPEPDATTTPAP